MKKKNNVSTALKYLMQNIRQLERSLFATILIFKENETRTLLLQMYIKHFCEKKTLAPGLLYEIKYIKNIYIIYNFDSILIAKKENFRQH
jgi:hypothetical protein